MSSFNYDPSADDSETERAFYEAAQQQDARHRDTNSQNRTGANGSEVPGAVPDPNSSSNTGSAVPNAAAPNVNGNIQFPGATGPHAQSPVENYDFNTISGDEVKQMLSPGGLPASAVFHEFLDLPVPSDHPANRKKV